MYKRQAEDCLDRITVKDGTKSHLIELADLLYIQSCGDYVTLITPEGEYIKEQTMKYFETHLPGSDFEMCIRDRYCVPLLSLP